MVELQRGRAAVYCVAAARDDHRSSRSSHSPREDPVHEERLALVSMFVLSLSATARADGNRGARDVTPDPAIFFSNFSQALAFRGENEVLAFSGRAGFRHSENRGDRWRRAMNGF